MALTLVQPLSLVLGETGHMVETNQRVGNMEQMNDSHVTLPVWLYWEGSVPSGSRRASKRSFSMRLTSVC